MARVQSNEANSLPAVSSLAVSLRSAATPGNLLVSGVMVNKTAGSRPAPTADYSTIIAGFSTSVSLGMAWRRADGTARDNITWSWTTAQNAVVWIAEWDGFTSISGPLLAFSFTDESNVASVAMGPVAAPNRGVAVAMTAVDTYGSWGTATTWSGGFTSFGNPVANDGISFDVGGGLGELIIPSAQAVSTTGTGGGGTDQASGIMAVFTETIIASSSPISPIYLSNPGIQTRFL